MATLNGDPTPSILSDSRDIIVADSTSLKRKRDDYLLAQSDFHSTNARAKLIQRDILQVLESHDTEPSFLNHPIADPTTPEPSLKKPKLAGPDSDTPTTTIAAKLGDAAYSTIQEIKADAAVVCQELVTYVRASASKRDASTGGRSSVEELKQIHRVQSLQTLLNELIDSEKQNDEPSDTLVKKGDSALTNGHALDIDAGAVRADAVLTLFGNAPTPKQLFSSMQNATSTHQGHSIKSELPVEEMSLPNGITATKILPVPDDKKGPTLEDIFAPPYSLPALNPPTAAKKTIGRENKIMWEFKDPVPRNKKGGYTVQPLTVGAWLGYGGVDEVDSGSNKAKRQERSRALSTSGEAREESSTSLSDEALAKEEEALFRRAYSSFAPTHDNSNSVIPEDIKNMIWWHKVGQQRYNAAFAIDPALLDESERSVRPPPEIEDIQSTEEDFSNIVEELDALDSFEPAPETVKSKTDVEQVLREISELLETLASHQRIRNASLPTTRDTAARTPISPAPTIASKIGKPDEPSDEEYSTYTSLRRELAYLVLKLPPYAVAKLDGDQLSELGVSKLIRFRAKEIKGTMEEDQVTRQAKLAAHATATSIANLARPSSSTSQHYSATASRTPAIGQAANTRYGQQYGTRTPAAPPQFQRQTSAQSSYGTPSATARPSYTAPNQWSRPGASQPGYGQANSTLYRPQQMPSGYGHYSQQYQQTPQAQRYNPQATQQYQQQQRTTSQVAAQGAMSYQSSSAAPQQGHIRTASPAKGYPAVSMAPTSNQQRPVYPGQPSQNQNLGSGRATPTGFPSQPNTPVNGYPGPPRPPQGIAPRPSSTTPQPLPQQAHPVPSPQQAAAIQPNGSA